MDNASIHCNRRIEELIISNGCEVLEGMSGSSRGRRRHDGFGGRGGGYKDVSTVKRLTSYLPVD